MKNGLWRAGPLLAGLAFGAPAMASQPQLSLPQWTPDAGWDFALTTRAPAPDLAVEAGDTTLYQGYQFGRELTRAGVTVTVVGYGVAAAGSGVLFISLVSALAGESSTEYGGDPLFTTGVTLIGLGSITGLAGMVTASIGAGKTMSALHLAGADINRRPGHIALGCLGVGVASSVVAPQLAGVANLGFIIFGIRQLVENKNVGNAYEAMGGFSLQLAPQRIGDTNGLALTGRW